MRMGTRAKGSLSARAQKAILYKIVGRLGKIKQGIHDALRALYIPYLPWFGAHMALGPENEHWRQGHFGQILEEKPSFQATMFWYAFNRVEASLSLLQNRK